MSSHVIKRTHEYGNLITPVLWCGTKYSSMSWYFQDTQHVALAVGGSVQPCKECIKAIITALEKEL